MDKYYHFTNYKSLERIKIEGLKPQNGNRCKSIGDDRTGIFLSNGIDNVIAMYALILGYYNKYAGMEGYIEMQNKLLLIEQLRHKFERSIAMKKLEPELERFNMIRESRDFNDYLGGDGCILSINGLNDSNLCQGAEDWWSINEISPNNISVLGLRHLYTNQYTDSREAVLSYFMSMYRFEDILNLVPDDRKNNIYQLCDYIYRYLGYIYCNPYWCYLVETPINCYNEDYIKVKALNNNH